MIEPTDRRPTIQTDRQTEHLPATPTDRQTDGCLKNIDLTSTPSLVSCSGHQLHPVAHNMPTRIRGVFNQRRRETVTEEKFMRFHFYSSTKNRRLKLWSFQPMSYRRMDGQSIRSDNISQGLKEVLKDCYEFRHMFKMRQP